MPDFKGQRKDKWYTAQKCAAACDSFIRRGRWTSAAWTESKAVRIARWITGEYVAPGDLKAAKSACERYMQRELMAERMEAIDGR